MTKTHKYVSILFVSVGCEEDEIPKFSKVVEYNWYITTDPYFNRYPRAKTLKICSIPHDELEEHLKGAQPLIKSGNSIRVKR